MDKGIMPYACHAWILATHFATLPPKYNIGLYAGNDPMFMVPAYSVAELGAMLQKDTRDCYYHNLSGMWTHHHTKWLADSGHELFATQAECYADIVLYYLHKHPQKHTADFYNQRLKKFYELKRVE